MVIRNAALIITALAMCALPAFAEDLLDLDALLSEDQGAQYKFPVIRPEYSLRLGYKLVFDGGSNAAEYYYPYSFVTASGHVRAFHYPHRSYVLIDAENEKDFFGDIRYAYGDRLFVRWLGRSLYHNTGRVDLKGDAGFINQSDAGTKYGFQTSINTIYFRVKVKDFPAHAFLDIFALDKDGTQQQRSLLGSGYFSYPVRSAMKRDVKSSTVHYTAGANSHLGPLEVQYSHTEKRFDAYGNDSMSDFYEAGPDRPEGTYAHNLTPEVQGSSDVINIHTAYTGMLTANATLSSRYRENLYSGATAQSFSGTTGISFMPGSNLAVFLRYMKKSTDIDTPSTVSIEDSSGALDTITYQVSKPAIDSASDSATLSIRYRPLRMLVLRASVLREDTYRANNELWGLPKSTEDSRLSASADIKLPMHVDIRAKYSVRGISGPAYNSDPDDSSGAEASLSWHPAERLSGLISLGFGEDARKSLRFEQGVYGNDREVNRSNLLVMANIRPAKRLYLSASHSIATIDMKQDVLVSGQDDMPVVYEGVSSVSTAQTFAVDMDYYPASDVRIDAGWTHTVSDNALNGSAKAFSDDFDLSSVGDFQYTEDAVYAGAGYRFMGGYEANIRYRISDLTEISGNAYDGFEGGRYQSIMISLSRQWQ